MLGVYLKGKKTPVRFIGLHSHVFPLIKQNKCSVEQAVTYI